MKTEFTSQVFKEGKMFVAHTPELDISSCTTMDQILKESGFSQRQQTLVGPKLIHTKRITMPLPPTHATLAI